MNWDAIEAIGEVVGAVAVVLTLIYLSVQLRQNTRSSKLAALQGFFDATSDTKAAVHKVGYGSGSDPPLHRV
ncbi:MAG: hypothetical protein ACR2PZ_03835 [Pseudomonadales bacterium]